MAARFTAYPRSHDTGRARGPEQPLHHHRAPEDTVMTRTARMLLALLVFSAGFMSAGSAVADPSGVMVVPLHSTMDTSLLPPTSPPHKQALKPFLPRDPAA